MNRREAGSIAFGLSIGFVASVGISFTLKTGLLNAWLLFLPTDILGVLAANSLLAFWYGGYLGRIDPHLPAAGKPVADSVAGRCAGESG